MKRSCAEERYLRATTPDIILLNIILQFGIIVLSVFTYDWYFCVCTWFFLRRAKCILVSMQRRVFKKKRKQVPTYFEVHVCNSSSWMRCSVPCVWDEGRVGHSSVKLVRSSDRIGWSPANVELERISESEGVKIISSVGDPNPNPNPKGSERFEGSESDQTVRIRIRIRKDPNANSIEKTCVKR